MSFKPLRENFKIVAAVIAVAFALFAGYSVVGYATDTFLTADAAGGGSCGNCIVNWIDGPNQQSFEYQSGGGGGGSYTPPPTPPPVPQCTLDLTKDKITWTTLNGYQVLISPLTASPQVPGAAITPYGSSAAVAHTETEAYLSPAVIADMAAGGVSLPSTMNNTGFAHDQTTMNRVCTLIDGQGSIASSWVHESYASPSNNALYFYNGSAWVRTGATGEHMRYSFSCSMPGSINSYPLNGSYNFVPPLGVGTHTYRLVVTGTGGTKTCDATVVVPPPPVAPTCMLTVNKSNIAPNEPVTFTWTSTNATEGHWYPGAANAGTSGTYTNSAISTTETFTLEFTGPGGSVQCAKTVTVTPPPSGECKMTIEKSVSATTANAGDEVEYTITFKNIGAKNCTGGGVRVSDVLDPLLTYKSETHSSDVTGGYGSDPVYKSSDRTLRWNANTLTPGESGWVKFKATAGTPTACSATVPNTAKITSYEYNNFQTFVTSNTVNVAVAKDCTPPTPPTCSLTASPYVLSSATQSTTLEWTTLNATTISIDNGVGSVTPVAYGTKSVVPGSTKTYTATVTGPGGTATCSKKITVTPPPGECKMLIEKSVNKTAVNAGDEVEYTITFKNIGTKDCTGGGVKVVDVVDTGLTYKSETHSSDVTGGYGSDPVYKSSDHTLRWNAATLTPGEEGWVKFKAKANTPSACTVTIPNAAKITSYEYNNFSTWETSNTVSVTVTKDCTPPTPKECKMIISKDVNDDTVVAGDEIEYTITFKNVGTADCTGGGVKIQDTLDASLSYKSETHSSNVTGGYGSDSVYKSSDRTVRFNAATLTPGEDGWAKIKAKVGTPTACTETIPNKAKITSYEYNNFKDWVESNVVNITVTKSCTVPQPVCSLSANPTTIDSGQSSTLTWTSNNVTSVTIDQGVGSVNTNGNRSVSPTANTTYTGTFTGPGGTVTCTAGITVTPPPNPVCTLSISQSQITPGQSVKITWSSTNATSGTISGVGNASPVAGGTSDDIFPSDDTTYVGTFKKGTQTVTCEVPVKVIKGTGGCLNNCGGGLNQPTVVLFQKPIEAPLAFVSLSQIPYTGFEAGPTLTVIFWAAVALLALIFTYILMGRGALSAIVGSAIQMAQGSNDDGYRSRAIPDEVSYGRVDSAAYSANGNASAATFNDQPAPQHAPVRAASDGIPDLADVIESRANGAGVLMSPEAVQSAINLSPDRIEALRMFGEILNNAVKTIPREDGWILLTSERFDSLTTGVSQPEVVAPVSQAPAEQSVETILADVMTPPKFHVVASSPNVEMPMAATTDQSTALELIQAVLGGNRDAAYHTVHMLEVGGANVSSVMTVIATALDQLYRARRHGTQTPLTLHASRLSEATVQKLVEVFAHGMDHGYENQYTALKLAVAQAFEARG